LLGDLPLVAKPLPDGSLLCFLMDAGFSQVTSFVSLFE
jgi:hypothetical protein